MRRLGRAWGWLAVLLATGWVLPVLPVQAQTGCSVLTLPAVLAQFADNVPYGGIFPVNVRNLACSSMTVTSQTAVRETTSGSPSVLTPGLHGTMVVSNGMVELSRDFGATWLQVGLVGGAVPMLGSDQIRVTWFGSIAPTVTLLPQTP